MLTLIHTNDTHGMLRPPSLDRLRALLADHPGAVYVDAGDAVLAGNLGWRAEGEPALREMTALGCAAMCLGNRETHPLRSLFRRKVADAGFPLLCANLRAKGAPEERVRPSLVLEAGGLTVGLFGVTVPMFTRRQWSQPLCDYWFEDPVAAARQVAADLRPRVQALIALTHLGFRRDLELAAAVPEVDLVIGGHSHTILAEPARGGAGPPVVQAGSHARLAGVACLEPAGDRARLISWRTVPLRE